jgi:hypothetical protein
MPWIVGVSALSLALYVHGGPFLGPPDAECDKLMGFRCLRTAPDPTGSSLNVRQ